MKDMPSKFCVVGLGNHSRTKLIPALLENGQALVGVVSSQKAATLGEATAYFSNLHEAIQELPDDVVFIVSSPPQVHYAQCKEILLAGRNVIVEKPAFVRESEALEMVALARKHGLVLAQALMYRHSALFERFMADMHCAGSNIESLHINFLLPDLPRGTFRNSSQLGASVVYDIGCYALSLLSEIGVDPAQVWFEHLAYKRDMLSRALLTGPNALRSPKINILIGVGAAYENSVRLIRRDESSTLYSPFFFGRPGRRNIHHRSREQKVSQEAVVEHNSFSKMLSYPLDSWIENQKEGFERMISVTRALEKLEMSRLRQQPATSSLI